MNSYYINGGRRNRTACLLLVVDESGYFNLLKVNRDMSIMSERDKRYSHPFTNISSNLDAVDRKGWWEYFISAIKKEGEVE